jgi:D-ribose pyranase
MKKVGILNSRLSGVIASLGHTDRLVICDCGLPIPRCREVVDLALTKNIPTFLDALRVVLQELAVEKAIVAEEIERENRHTLAQIERLLAGVPIQKVPHEEFKKIAHGDSNTRFVRTGEATPYANIILISGVTFDCA